MKDLDKINKQCQQINTIRKNKLANHKLYNFDNFAKNHYL